MRNTALSLQALRTGSITPVEGFASVEDAVVNAIVVQANKHISEKRSVQLHDASPTNAEQAAGKDASPPPDVEEHYFIDIPPGIVSGKILERVVDAFGDWPFADMVGDQLVVGRTTYVPQKTYGGPKGSLVSHPFGDQVPFRLDAQAPAGS